MYIILAIGREREKSSARPSCSIFEQKEPWTEPQLNLKSSEYIAQ
jgi:hypothetical protein